MPPVAVTWNPMVGSVVWGARDDRGVLHLEPACPRLVRAAELDQAVVVRLEVTGRVTAQEQETGYLRTGPPCRVCR